MLEYQYFKHFQNVYNLIFVPILGLLAPIAPLVHLVIFLVFVDLITAIWKGFKDDKVKGLIAKIRYIRPNKLRRTLVKLILYILSITIAYLIPFVCFNHSFYIAETFTAYIALIESKSIAENMDLISGTDRFTYLFRKFQKMIIDKITKSTSDDEKNNENV